MCMCSGAGEGRRHRFRATPPPERAAGEYLAPGHGHVHAGETSVALRATRDGGGTRPVVPYAAISVVGRLNRCPIPFYPCRDCTVVMSPRFACEVRPEWSPRLNEEHAAHRWTPVRDMMRCHVAGQKACCREILREIVAGCVAGREGLRIR